ncbi:hypothetical protein CK221_03620 [Mesorhizobium sp. WSM3868]|nr:hypothetical protein CK221_03620 [Mesorhizobium sp. WSM3868]
MSAEVGALRRPPLACRPSPPQVGRCRVGFRQSPTFASKGAKGRAPISPLAGEMSGRTEGGAVPPAFNIERRCCAGP